MQSPQSADDGFSRVIFDSTPLPMFLVRDDVRIVDFNDAAAGLLGEGKESALQKRGGEALHCINSTKTPDGCGRSPECRSCVIRNSVNQSLSGYKVVRSRHKVELNVNGEKTALEILVTTAPIKHPDNKLVLMIFEDISELAALRTVVPICAGCKRLRSDEKFWSGVENYFSSHMGVDFTHGICPDCLRKFYPQLAADVLPKDE